MLISILIALLPYALFTGGLVVCVFVFIDLKRELHGIANSMKQQRKELEALIQSMAGELEAAKADLRDVQEQAGVLVAPPPPQSGFNLSKRSQVMRLSRQGENAENIAAALNLPRREVELLLKVQKIVLDSALRPTS